MGRGRAAKAPLPSGAPAGSGALAARPRPITHSQ